MKLEVHSTPRTMQYAIRCNNPSEVALAEALRQFVLLMRRSASHAEYTVLPHLVVGQEAAEEKGVDLSEILKTKKGSDGEKKSKGMCKRKRWHATVKSLLGDWRKQDGDPTDAKNNNRQLDRECSLEDLDPSDMTLLQLLALNALDLTAPASDILLKNRKNNWVQLSGHEGAFAPAGPGTIWKKRTSKDDCEVKAYENLMNDSAADLVPRFYKEVEWNGEYYIEMEDLLHNFKDPSVMDIKMGTRTFSESEVTNQKGRADLYHKMVKVDPSAPTAEEHANQAVTKMRYMTFREQQSSSSTLGFRIEALKLEGSAPVKDLKLVRNWDEVVCTMNLFLAGREDCRRQLIDRFTEMRNKLERSQFFRTHEVVGSSILIVLDQEKAGAWMIDFAKTVPLPSGTTTNHRKIWQYGNHEDGYLLGLDNLIKILETGIVQSSTEASRDASSLNAIPVASGPASSTSSCSKLKLPFLSKSSSSSSKS